MAGVTFPIGSAAREWSIGYRYFGTADATLVTTDGTAFTQDGPNSHSANAGLRFYF